MKVYILTQYDVISDYEWICGIFDSEEKALKCKTQHFDSIDDEYKDDYTFRIDSGEVQ